MDRGSLSYAEAVSLIGLTDEFRCELESGSIDIGTAARFLLANKGDPKRAAARLRQLLEMRATRWNWPAICEQQVTSALDGLGITKGYWQTGGLDASGLRTGWMMQANAVPPQSLEVAQAGVAAAHRYWSAVCTDAPSLRDGITLVIVMSGVTAAGLATNRSKFAAAVGNAYQGVMPLRVRRILIVECGGALRLAVQALAAATLKRKERCKMEFISFDRLGELVPPASWPLSLQAAGAIGGVHDGQVPVSGTSSWCAERNAEFARWCTSELQRICADAAIPLSETQRG